MIIINNIILLNVIKMYKLLFTLSTIMENHYTLGNKIIQMFIS